VTAGASTPNWLIDQVVNRLREIGDLQEAVSDPVTIN
jgi:4-hydroxy-3-methylbut-2-enyl diphosphate reductase IspH